MLAALANTSAPVRMRTAGRRPMARKNTKNNNVVLVVALVVVGLFVLSAVVGGILMLALRDDGKPTGPSGPMPGELYRGVRSSGEGENSRTRE